MAETIRVVREGGLVEVVLNRPDKLNSVNRQMIRELSQALEEAGEAPAGAAAARRGARLFRRARSGGGRSRERGRRGDPAQRFHAAA